MYGEIHLLQYFWEQCGYDNTSQGSGLVSTLQVLPGKMTCRVKNNSGWSVSCVHLQTFNTVPTKQVKSQYLRKTKPNSESGSGVEQTKESQEKKIDALRKEVSNMTVEELEEIVKSKKRGRPKKDEKELRQLSKKELDRKKSISGGPNPKDANE